MRVRERALDWVERRTTRVRSRHAADLFQTGRTRATDRAIARVYFELAARRWAGYEDDAHHLSAFAAGLEGCRPPRDVLDLACGTGGSAAMVATRYPMARVVAVDTSRAMLRLAHARYPGLELRRASVRRLPFPDGTFDLVTCVNAVPEPIELRRVAKPNAQLLLAATTLPLRDASDPWVARWSEMGFRRIAAGDVEGGSWERYER